MNRPNTGNEIQTVIKQPPTNKSPGPVILTDEFYQIFRKELPPILLKIFQNITEEGTLPNSFYEVSITLIPKPEKISHAKRRFQVNMNINVKILNKMLANKLSNT